MAPAHKKKFISSFFICVYFITCFCCNYQVSYPIAMTISRVFA